jgi:hypothetical protein
VVVVGQDVRDELFVRRSHQVPVEALKHREQRCSFAVENQSKEKPKKGSGSGEKKRLGVSERERNKVRKMQRRRHPSSRALPC